MRKRLSTNDGAIRKNLPEVEEDFGYSEEQLYETFLDYDELYGPDAYLGDQYASMSGEVARTFLPASPPELELSDELRQEKEQEYEEMLSESVESAETEAARDRSPPEE